MAKKKAANAREREYMGAVAALGCAACRHIGYEDTPAEVHHIRLGKGRGQRASHYDTIPLCTTHHRGTNGTSFHQTARAVWEEKYGIELDHLADTKHQLRSFYE